MFQFERMMPWLDDLFQGIWMTLGLSLFSAVFRLLFGILINYLTHKKYLNGFYFCMSTYLEDPFVNAAFDDVV